MKNEAKKIQLISDFNIEPFARLANQNTNEKFEFLSSEYGQVYQVLTQKIDQYWGLLLWVSPSLISEFSNSLNFNIVDEIKLEKEVSLFADAIISRARDVDYILVVNWNDSQYEQNIGPLSLRKNGSKYLISKMNIKLTEILQEESNILIFDSNSWLINTNTNPVSKKLWYLSKNPYSNEVYENAFKDIFSSIQASQGLSKKLLILDLDNTLWGGVVGEVGWEHVNIGGHDFIGEAYSDFQSNLKKLTKMGIQLAICSKNDESTAMEVFRKNEEMILKEEDISCFKINWKDKALNIKEIVEELNLGLQSVVFLDDSPYERDRASSEFPELLVPELPKDPTNYSTFLSNLSIFRSNHISEEDTTRTKMYASEMKRKKEKSSLSSLDDWLNSLETKINVQEINESNLLRVEQLFNKTNQVNLTTRRLSGKEINKLAQMKSRDFFVFSVEDKFGELGLIGIVGLLYKKDICYLSDFIMSCRAMGRGVEQTMLVTAFIHANENNAKKFIAEYIPTEKNRPTLDILNSFEHQIEGNNTHHFPLDKDYQIPSYIEFNKI